MVRDAIVLIGSIVSTALGLVICWVLAKFLVTSIRESARDRSARAGGVDVRHVAATLVMACAFASGLIAAGASVLVCALAALVGAAVGVLLAAVVPEWQGSRAARWAVGAVWCAIGIVGIVVSLAIRPDV